MKTVITIVQLTTIIAVLSMSAAQLCPPAEVLFPCRCSEFDHKPSIHCSGIDDTVNLKEIFDNASSIVDTDILFHNLFIANSPHLDLKDGTFEHFKFHRIFLDDNPSIRHLSSRAFNASRNVTVSIQIVGFGLEDPGNFYEFIRSFHSLEELALYEQEQNGTVSIPTNAFQNMTSLWAVVMQNCNVSQIESKAFSGLPSLTDIYLVGNRIPSEGLPEDAFEGVGGNITVQLQYNGMEFMEGRSYQRLLDQARMVHVGRGDGVPSFHCDERADWICENEGRYRGKLEGFLCMGEEFQDVWEYCGGRNYNNTRVY